MSAGEGKSLDLHQSMTNYSYVSRIRRLSGLSRSEQKGQPRSRIMRPMGSLPKSFSEDRDVSQMQSLSSQELQETLFQGWFLILRLCVLATVCF